MEKTSKELELDALRVAHTSYIEKLQRFVYYIMALCTSAIGFSVYGTKDKNLEFSDLILFASVMSWMLCVFSGLKIIKLLIDDDTVNVSMLNNQTELKSALEIKELMKPLFGFYYKILWRSFFIGIVLYLIWHIVQMIYNSGSTSTD